MYQLEGEGSVMRGARLRVACQEGTSEQVDPGRFGAEPCVGLVECLFFSLRWDGMCGCGERSDFTSYLPLGPGVRSSICGDDSANAGPRPRDAAPRPARPVLSAERNLSVARRTRAGIFLKYPGAFKMGAGPPTLSFDALASYARNVLGS
ncbi:hypothetical protein B0H17DRAFT_1124881 [Mycena rosella]|uniref:Uncharacterized protein n=1 Tax=Mycena rosella TaxID=1033263 RepID=A0AAD7MAJ6_MYCRO|nr:hypothetical protein B0H17DRAFT_1124881 [Mycena rosella]